MPELVVVLQSPTFSELRLRMGEQLLLCLSDIGELKAKIRQFHVFMQQQLNRSPSLTRKIVFSRINPSFWCFSPSYLAQIPSRSGPFLLRDHQFSPEYQTFCILIGRLIGSACIVPSGLLFEGYRMFLRGAPICLLYSFFSDRIVDYPFIEYHTARRALFSRPMTFVILGSFFGLDNFQ
jgi:hypothetical protein